MSESTTETPAVEAEGAVDAPATDTQATQDVQTDATDELGDAGKKALEAIRAERNAARREAREAREEADRYKAAAEGREAEWQAEKNARDAAAQQFAERYRNAEVKAAAKGKVDPDLALKLLDLDAIEVSEDGTVDPAAVESAIDSLIKKYPNLAVRDERRFNGSPDAGPRDAVGPRQYTREEIKGMTPEQIDAALSNGQLDAMFANK